MTTATNKYGDEIDPALADDKAAHAAFMAAPGAAATLAKQQTLNDECDRRKPSPIQKAYDDGFCNVNGHMWMNAPALGKAWNTGRRDRLAGAYNPPK